MRAAAAANVMANMKAPPTPNYSSAPPPGQFAGKFASKEFMRRCAENLAAARNKTEGKSGASSRPRDDDEDEDDDHEANMESSQDSSHEHEEQEEEEEDHQPTDDDEAPRRRKKRSRSLTRRVQEMMSPDGPIPYWFTSKLNVFCKKASGYESEEEPTDDGLMLDFTMNARRAFLRDVLLVMRAVGKTVHKLGETRGDKPIDYQFVAACICTFSPRFRFDVERHATKLGSEYQTFLRELIGAPMPMKTPRPCKTPSLLCVLDRFLIEFMSTHIENIAQYQRQGLISGKEAPDSNKLWIDDHHYEAYMAAKIAQERSAHLLP